MFVRSMALAATLAMTTATARGPYWHHRGLKSSKGSKGAAGGSSMIKEVPFCPNYSGGHRSKSSKGTGSTSSSCKDGEVQDVTCGDTFVNATISLSGDLDCSEHTGIVITMEGPEALLDCKGRTIRGAPVDSSANDIVRLNNGASVVNCNFINGYNAVETTGEGCSTIDRVSASYTTNDAIIIKNKGTAILTDIIVVGSDNDGIEIDVVGDGEVLVVVENAQVTGAHSNGICFLNAPSSGARVEFYGDIVLDGSNLDGLDIDDSNFDLTIYGTFSSNGSNDIGIDNNSGSNVTFAKGSTADICFNIDGDVRGTVVVADGATVACDTGTGSGDCTEACTNFQNTTEACVE